MKSILVLILFFPALLLAGECPDLTGSYKCAIASDTLDIQSKKVNGVWQYEGDQISVFGPIYADGVERLKPGYEKIEGTAFKYKAYCKDENLIVVTKTLYEDGQGWEDIDGPTEEGGREIFGLKSNGSISLRHDYYDEAPQRDPKDIDWEKDTAGRKVKKEYSFSCRRN